MPVCFADNGFWCVVGQFAWRFQVAIACAGLLWLFGVVPVGLVYAQSSTPTPTDTPTPAPTDTPAPTPTDTPTPTPTNIPAALYPALPGFGSGAGAVDLMAGISGFGVLLVLLVRLAGGSVKSAIFEAVLLVVLIGLLGGVAGGGLWLFAVIVHRLLDIFV